MGRVWLVVTVHRPDSEYICSDIFIHKKDAIRYMIVNFGFERPDLEGFMTYSEAVEYIEKYKKFPPESVDSVDISILEEKRVVEKWT